MPAIGKTGIKRYSKTNTAKKKEVRGEVGRGPITAKKKKEKKYTSKFSDTQAKAKKAITSNKAYTWKFGDAFKNAKKEGKKVFTWNNKKYTTQTKDELETGAKEKTRFERAAKAKEATPDKKDKKRNIFQKLVRKLRGTNPDGSTRTQAEFEAARDARRKAKKAS